MVGRNLTAKFRTVSSCEYSTEKSYTITDRVLLTFSQKQSRKTKDKNKNKTDSISHDVVAFSPSKTTVLLPYCWRTHNMHNNLHIYDFFSFSTTPPAILFVYPHILSYIHQVVAVWSDTKIPFWWNCIFCIWSFYIGVKCENRKSHQSWELLSIIALSFSTKKIQFY